MFYSQDKIFSLTDFVHVTTKPWLLITLKAIYLAYLGLKFIFLMHASCYVPDEVNEILYEENQLTE